MLLLSCKKLVNLVNCPWSSLRFGADFENWQGEDETA